MLNKSPISAQSVPAIEDLPQELISILVFGLLDSPQVINAFGQVDGAPHDLS